MSTRRHEIQPFWESVKPEEISLSLVIAGENVITEFPALVEDLRDGHVEFQVKVPDSSEISRAVVALTQKKHWQTVEVALKKLADNQFSGKVDIQASIHAPDEAYQFEVLLYGMDQKDGRPVGRSRTATLLRKKGSMPAETNWSSIPQEREDFVASGNPLLKKANKHLWRLLYVNGRITIYFNVHGIRQEHYDLLRTKHADPTKRLLQNLVNALIAKSAMAAQQSWDMLTAVDLSDVDSLSFAEVPMVKGLKMAAQIPGGPADQEQIGILLCEIEFQERSKQKLLSDLIDRCLKQLAEVD
jgi:hypothetical protein